MSKNQVLLLSQAGTYVGALIQKESGFYLQLVFGNEQEIKNINKRK